MAADGMVEGADEGQLDQQRMADGRPLTRRSWVLPGARKSILLVHGLGEHSGRYAALAQWLHRRGYDVRSYDQRGHGRTGGARGALPRATALLEDLAEIYAAYAADRAEAPLLLGHSMGGLLALRSVLAGRVRPSRLVLSSPALRTFEPAWRQRLAATLARWAPRLPLPNGLPVDALSHDEAVVQAYREDPLCHGWITPRLGHFVIGEGAACIAQAGRLATPTLLLVAAADRLVDPAGSEAFAAAAPPRYLQWQRFPGLYHELFNEAEPGRQAVMDRLASWLG